MDSIQSIQIEYCVKCKWLLRAAWLAQELLSTFEEDLGGVTLVPGKTPGVFDISLGDELLWSREKRGRFPDIKELKQLVRDHVAPGKELGHLEAT